MSLPPPVEEVDPRLAPGFGPGPPPVEALRPRVADTRPPRGTALVVAGACALGLVAFLFLNAHRTTAPSSNPRGDLSGAIAPPPPMPSDIAATENAARAGAATALPAALAVPAPSSPPVAPIAPGIATAPTMTLPAAVLTNALGVTGTVDIAGRKSPTLIVDIADLPDALVTVAATAVGKAISGDQASTTAPSGVRLTTPTLIGSTTPTGAVATGLGVSAITSARRSTGNILNSDEEFAQRVGDTEPEHARATVIHNTRMTIPQGAMMPGVLETALDSDLPGFARAVISRDVRGFDGSTILIPRGSRVIGQYKSAVSQGQSRAFVIWTRVIRPDGASIQIGSSGTDPLGRAGLEGSVDRHFFERFGGSILLSVINAGTAALARSPSTQVVIGSSNEATTAGAAALSPQTIPPTIKVPQGSPIRIFVARDLDFSPVGAGK